MSTQTVTGTADISLNRNILECKCKVRKRMGYKIDVLIETYWNVN